MELTEVERRLIEHVVDGTLVDFAPEASDEDMAGAPALPWNEEHQIRATVICDILRGRFQSATGPAPRALRIRGAWIVGRIDLDGIATAVRLQLTSCYLPDGLDGRECVVPHLQLDWCVITASEQYSAHGAVRLMGARISGQLNLQHATLTNDAGPALNAPSLTVDGNAFLSSGFTADAHAERGAVHLAGAHVMGQLDLSDAILTNDEGPALTLHSVTVDGNASLSGSFTANGHGGGGAVNLTGAHIMGDLLMSHATLTNDTGPALLGNRALVGGDAFFDGGLAATGHGERGAVNLAGARIMGQLRMRDATLSNDSGPALRADSMTVDGNVLLDGRFAASGHGDGATVNVQGMHITGQLLMAGARLTNDTGPALHAFGMTVDGNAFLECTFTAGGGERRAVNLTGAHIGGRLFIDEPNINRALLGDMWLVDGLTYEGYPGVGFDRWLDLLRSGTPAYRPQPYRQLAAAARAAGHDDDARRALIAQRDDQVKRGDLTSLAKAWAGFTRFTLGYGYQPWRALMGVLLVMVAALLVTFLTPGALAHSVGAAPCTPAETFQIAVDMAIPLVSTSTGTGCHVTASPGGQFVAWAGVVIALSGWALTALFAAGFTRAIRQP